MYASEQRVGLSESLANLVLDNTPMPLISKIQYDQNVLLAGQILLLKLNHVNLEDKLKIRDAFKTKYPKSTRPPAFRDGTPVKLIRPFLEKCLRILQNCKTANLPKLAVEATLSYAHVTRLRCSIAVGKTDEVAKVAKYRKYAKALLGDAAELCRTKFEGADDLATAVEDSLQLLGKEFYQEVTKEEVEAIKRAMLSDPRGIATHSGHWFKCENGHPVCCSCMLRCHNTNLLSLPSVNAVYLWSKPDAPSAA